MLSEIRGWEIVDAEWDDKKKIVVLVWDIRFYRRSRKNMSSDFEEELVLSVMVSLKLRVGSESEYDLEKNMWWKKTCGMMGEWVVSPGPLEKIWGWTMMKYWFSVRWVDISWELRLGFREKYEVILWEKKVVVGVWEKKVVVGVWAREDYPRNIEKI